MKSKTLWCTLVFAALSATASAQTTSLEDFTSDSNPAVAGLASTRFVHAFSGGNRFVDETELPGIAPFPTSPFALWLLNGRDDVTFSLGAGEAITRARVGANSTYGEGHVTFEGENGETKSFTFLGAGGWGAAEVLSTDTGDTARVLGSIVRITLIGFETVYDDVEVDVSGGGTGPARPGVLIRENASGRPKQINVRSGGLVKVTVLSDASFDATTMDANSVHLGAATAAFRYHLTDDDGDGDLDLVLWFRIADVGIHCGDTDLVLTGFTTGGQPVEGIGAIETVGC